MSKNIEIIDSNDENFKEKLDFLLNIKGIPTTDEIINELNNNIK